MNPFVYRLAAISITAAALAACGKKPEEPAPEAPPSAESMLPISEQVAAGKAVPEPAAEPPTGAELLAGPGAMPADPATAGVPADLLASDQAYEAWFKKFELDLRDPKMLEADTDGDGATNRDEFMADTNPRDPGSRPGIHKVMRLKEYAEVRVPFVLESVEGQTARIKRLDGEQKSESVTLGQTYGGMKVGKIASRHESDKNGHPVDLSRVDLEDPVTKEKVVLVKDMVAKSGATSAVLSSADGTTMKVHQGETFTWPTEKGATYRVIDLRADQVVVQEVESKRMWTIPRQ